MRLAAFFLCIGLVTLALNIEQPPWAVHIDVGNEGPFIYDGETTTFYNYFVFYDPERWGERVFRWTRERGTVTIPAALRMQPLVLDIVACGCRPDGSDIPITLLLNDQYITTLTGGAGWRRYTLTIPQDLAHPEHNLTVDLRAPVWTDASDRLLGVAVDQIAVRQPAPDRLADPLGLPALAAGLLVLLLWRRAPWLLLALTAAWLLVNATYQPHLLPRWLSGSLVVAGLLALWWLAERTTAPRDDEHASSPAHALLALLLALAVALWLVLCLQLLGAWIIDDAFISFRYARNLVQGHGLVFNPGEYVEGYTNFLWTMLIAGVLALGWEPVLASTVLLLLLAFACVMLTVTIARRWLAPAWAWAAGALLVVNGSFLLYTARGSGMETGLFAALILAALLALLRRAWLLAGLLTALTLMTRPDGVLLAAAGGVYALWTGWQAARLRWRRWAMLRPLLWYGGTLAALYLPYFLWRWSYYGYLLPNTFYVKVGSTWAQVARGGGYLGEFAAADPLLVLGAAGGLLGLWGWRGRRVAWDEVALLAGLALLITLYVVAVGGDWMPGRRFFVALLPLLAILGVWGLAGLARRFPPLTPLGGALVIMAAIVMAVDLPANTSLNRSPIWTQNYVVRRRREVGRWINAHTPPDMHIATAVAGAIPYYARRHTIDILGLTDEHIAHLPSATLGTGRPGHEKTDLDYVLARNPAIIPYKGSDLFWGHPVFQQRYDLQEFAGPEGHAVRLYVRNDVELPE